MTEMIESNSFGYQAQTVDGLAVSGTIDAPNLDEAGRRLLALRLRVLEIEPVGRPARAKPLRGDDFLAFNQQLTHLTKAGLPVEHGLRLIAQDMRSGRLAETVRQVAQELERGTPLGAAFEKHHAQFPPLYGKLIAAGVRTNNLPGMLLSLGRHMELIMRLRAMLWRAAAYPIMVLGGLVLIVVFLGMFVLPNFDAMFRDFGMKLPAITLLILGIPRAMPIVIAIAVLLFVGLPLLWLVFRLVGWDRQVVDHVILPLPLIGSILRRNMIARWCDAAKLGVQSGLDLPASIELAGDAVGSPKLLRDGYEISAAIQAGQTPDHAATRMLPPTVAAAMALSSDQHELGSTLGTLGEMYQQQAESRLAMLPGLLTPLLIIIIAIVIGFVILGLFAPFLSLIQTLSGGGT
jgi:type IV pilus assembly protein PilC